MTNILAYPGQKFLFIIRERDTDRQNEGETHRQKVCVKERERRISLLRFRVQNSSRMPIFRPFQPSPMCVGRARSLPYNGALERKGDINSGQKVL